MLFQDRGDARSSNWTIYKSLRVRVINLVANNKSKTLPVDELVFESELPTLQAKWEADAALEPCLIYSEPGTEMDKGVYHCNHRLSCPIESFLAARLTGLNS